MGSHQNRFPQQQRQESRKRWGGCWGAVSCFGSQKGGKRIVPASRIPEGNGSVPQPNGVPPIAMVNQAAAIHPSLLAPPSSPASFTHSALPSTVQSPNCQLSISANSPGGPSSTMFVTGPYAHETQLVSPPVFSAFTTEPSTAPLTPPPELAHLTTPSSPDVPYAQFLTSARGIRVADKTGGYSYYPGSPASSVISPVSRISGDGLSSFPKREYPLCWDTSVSPPNDGYIANTATGASGKSHDTNFFCPATFAEFYLDHNPPFPHTGGRLSISKDSDAYSTADNGYKSRQSNRSPKQDPEEMEAYRASFGFSADEIITTSQYVEITDVANDSFTMRPLGSGSTHLNDSLGTSFHGEVHGIFPSSSRRVNSGLVSNDSRSEASSWQNQRGSQLYNGLGHNMPTFHTTTDDERRGSRGLVR
ncbi:hypothetical protein MLD38_001879 [Melastoma candidum]|uniref:Uncharacterized protein n=1 Tax=Melastoma candidum TaxID=119954 RepID=A0ACB9SG95_9MYRT|nr:hypothetical protein MLD38_001879 [Melastoma candidum]